ncbi:MAG: DUF177 domain-containing protein [Candidatus Omnitrophota bacterium]|jgi:uncharacterized protein
MKIDVRNIPPEGLFREENIPPEELDMETELVSLSGPVAVKARIFRIGDILDINAAVSAVLELSCSRCLCDYSLPLAKAFRFDHRIESGEEEADLTPYIRDELMVDYPVKPLCNDNCKGLCRGCGADLNKGGCSCGATKEKTL